ncbi:MAG: hypothetical protein B7Z04_12285 [Rhodobacterales bacterium 32-66-9]|nr:MAG: hypothetical protein B7Z04_12285 [Rhodobacterales bacterium 32-66-9]
MAEITGLNRDYCSDVVKKLCRERGITYNPIEKSRGEFPVGITEDSRQFRAKIGNILYDLRQEDHHVKVALDTGVIAKNQVLASEFPNAYSWSLGQLERLARRTNIPFKEMMLKALMTTEEWNLYSQCVKSLKPTSV